MKKAKLLSGIVIPAVAVIATNWLIFSLGWDTTFSHSTPWLNPAGELIGMVWLVLFILMGMARYYVKQSRHDDSSKVARWIVYYMLFCLSYPFYTLGFSNEVMKFVGNIATFVAAVWLIVKIRRVSMVAVWCLVPILPWVIYATIIIV